MMPSSLNDHAIIISERSNWSPVLKTGDQKKINVYVYYIILFLICTLNLVFFALFYVFFRFLGQSNVFDPFNFFLILWAFKAFFEYF